MDDSERRTGPELKMIPRNLEEVCRRILRSRSLRDEAKVEARKEELEQHPERMISPDIKKLRQIVDFVSFKCNPQSSVARGMAVRGSDIDGGLVVLKEAIDKKTEQDFVDELRHQGFDVYSEQEAEEASAAEKQTYAMNEDPTEALRTRIKMESQMILFRTKKRLDEMKSEPLTLLTAIYVVGKQIREKE